MAGNNSHRPGTSAGAALGRRPHHLTRSGAGALPVSCWVLLALPGALAQSGPTLIGIGNTLTRFALVAPGDIVTLQVVGLKTIVFPAPVKASGIPLPTVLAGISVAFREFGINLPGPPVEVPLFSIEQIPICGDEFPTPDCLRTSITIQVPFFGDTLGSRGISFAISENGVSSKRFGAGGIGVNIHIVTVCRLPAEFCVPDIPAVTHADGTLVTAASPAKPGELVVIYATGLGETIPPVPPGQPTPTPAPRARNGLYLQFDFSPNASPRRPYGDPMALRRPEFVGLTPGQVGLYQINVRIPDMIPAVPPCGDTVPGGWAVLSNLTISVNGDIFHRSFDGAGICVAPPQ